MPHKIQTVQAIMIDPFFKPTLEWIRDDWKSNGFRFCVELLAWAISIGCSITMSVRVPNPPLLVIYPILISGCAMYACASWTRNSFGMLANYILLVSIDCFGLSRIILNMVVGTP
jgi:hypothetical protein